MILGDIAEEEPRRSTVKLHDQIRVAREALGIDQRELPRRMEVSKQAVALWESGGNVPRLPKLQKLEKILNTSFNVTGKHNPGLPLWLTPESMEVAKDYDLVRREVKEVVRAVLKLGALSTVRVVKPFVEDGEEGQTVPPFISDDENIYSIGNEQRNGTSSTGANKAANTRTSHKANH